MRRLSHAVADYLHDLGVGGWLLVLTGVAVVAVVVAVIAGRGGPEKLSCDRAAPCVDTIGQLSQSGPLSSVEVARLHDAAVQLGAIARTPFGDDTRAIKDAARVAAGAGAGQSLAAAKVLGEFDAACPRGGLGH